MLYNHSHIPLYYPKYKVKEKKNQIKEIRSKKKNQNKMLEFKYIMTLFLRLLNIESSLSFLYTLLPSLTKSNTTFSQEELPDSRHKRYTS